MSIPTIAIIYQDTVCVLSKMTYNIKCYECNNIIKKGKEAYWVQWEDDSHPIYCKVCVNSLRKIE